MLGQQDLEGRCHTVKLEDYDLENEPRIDWFDFWMYLLAFASMAFLILFFMWVSAS